MSKFGYQIFFLFAKYHFLSSEYDFILVIIFQLGRMPQTVRYKTRTGPGRRLVKKRGPGLVIKHGLMDCMYAMIIGLLSLMRF